MQVASAKGMLQQTVVNAGKVDITGREAGFSKGDVGLIATPSPVPGNSLSCMRFVKLGDICHNFSGSVKMQFYSFGSLLCSFQIS